MVLMASLLTTNDMFRSAPKAPRGAMDAEISVGFLSQHYRLGVKIKHRKISYIYHNKQSTFWVCAATRFGHKD